VGAGVQSDGAAFVAQLGNLIPVEQNAGPADRLQLRVPFSRARSSPARVRYSDALLFRNCGKDDKDGVTERGA
jgi:hypothetical protein